MQVLYGQMYNKVSTLHTEGHKTFELSEIWQVLQLAHRKKNYINEHPCLLFCSLLFI